MTLFSWDVVHYSCDGVAAAAAVVAALSRLYGDLRENTENVCRFASRRHRQSAIQNTTNDARARKSDGGVPARPISPPADKNDLLHG